MELVKELVFKNDTIGLERLLEDQDEYEYSNVINDNGMEWILELQEDNEMIDFLYKEIIGFDDEKEVSDCIIEAMYFEKYSSIKKLIRTSYKLTPRYYTDRIFRSLLDSQFMGNMLILFYKIYFENIIDEDFCNSYLETYNTKVDKYGLTNQNTYLDAIFDLLSKKSVEYKNRFYIEINKFNMKNTHASIKARPAFREITNNYKEYLYEPEGPIGKKIVTGLNLQRLKL